MAWHLTAVPILRRDDASQRNVAVNPGHHRVDVLLVRVLLQHFAQIVDKPGALVDVSEGVIPWEEWS